VPISITPVIPPQAGLPVSLDQVLQPGAVLEARVLAQLDAALTRILIANVAIDVTTEAPLAPGTMLRVAVSRGADGGVQLSVAPPDEPAAPLPRPAASPDPATVAVAQATRQAATRQSGLSPLFADLAAALEQDQLPPQIRAAAAPLLAMRPVLSAGISAPQVQKALQQSGLLLESSVAAGRLPQTQRPDLKAALIVLRQVLSQWQGTAAPAPAPSSALPLPATPATAGPPIPAIAPGVPLVAADATRSAPVATPPTVTPNVAAPPLAPAASSAASAVSDEFILALTTPPRAGPSAMPRGAAPSASAMLAMLQDIGEAAGNALSSPGLARAIAPTEASITAKTQPPRTSSDVPPPPYRGAPPSAQSVALPNVHPDDTPQLVAHKLIDDVDGALARQTLLQIASLPDQPLQQGQRAEQPRWAFEIPFATPQGTAVAQFEISRDGHSSQEVEPAKRVWRARFSLNVEPAGPVHAAIALTGERASVRLWAERPETIARLRDSTALLSHALREAELDPGEITVGRPPQSAPAAAGQFWNKAS
jgi:hypothetical protein